MEPLTALHLRWSRLDIQKLLKTGQSQEEEHNRTPSPQTRLRHAQVVSQAEAQGRVKVAALSEVQGRRFEEPTVLIAEAVGGMEDIPVQSCKEQC